MCWDINSRFAGVLKNLKIEILRLSALRELLDKLPCCCNALSDSRGQTMPRSRVTKAHLDLFERQIDLALKRAHNVGKLGESGASVVWIPHICFNEVWMSIR